MEIDNQHMRKLTDKYIFDRLQLFPYTCLEQYIKTTRKHATHLFIQKQSFKPDSHDTILSLTLDLLSLGLSWLTGALGFLHLGGGDNSYCSVSLCTGL